MHKHVNHVRREEEKIVPAGWSVTNQKTASELVRDLSSCMVKNTSLYSGLPFGRYDLFVQNKIKRAYSWHDICRAGVLS